MEICNCEQLSPEWWKIRAKRMTASQAQAISAQGAGLKTYIEKIMQEYYSNAEPDNFSNYHTDRGLDLENSAAMVYCFEKNVIVKKVGFITMGDYVGCSPDLLVGDDGLVEIKAHADKAHFSLLLGNDFESKYRWQAQCQMLITGRKYCDLVSYNPNFNKYLVIKRQEPDQEKFDKLLKGFELGEKMIKEIEYKMNKIGA